MNDSEIISPLLPVVTKAFSRAPASTGFSPTPSALLTGALTDGWHFDVFDQADAIDAAWWGALFPAAWKDRRYYRTLEETFADDFSQFYLLLRDETGRPRVIQPLFLVRQDITVSLPLFLQRLLQPFRRQLSVRLLMVGCIVGDGQIGVPDRDEVPEVFGPLDEAIALFARHEQARIILFKDFPAVYRPALTGQKGYTRLPSLPAVGLPLDFSSFEDYLQNRLGRSTRKSLRRKFREVDSLPDPIEFEVKTSVTPAEADALHALYERVARQGDRHFEVFSSEYFLRLGERMPERTRYFIWKRNGCVIAFSFCIVYEDTVYDNDLGMDSAAAMPLHLYYVTFRDIVRWALAHGLRYYQSSPFNYAPKLHLRMELLPLDLYVRHTSPLINRLMSWFAPLVAPTRQEPLLASFPNAGEI